MPKLPSPARLPWLLAGLVILAGPRLAPAAVEADPAKDYRVSPAEGPWMVCVASYMGEPAPKLAHDLALEIRQRYGLPAFVYNRGDEERRKEQEELDEQRRKQQEYLKQMGFDADLPVRHRKVRVEDQYAVLVGGYKDIDEAHRAQASIKKLEAPKSVPADTFLSADASALNQVKKETINPFTTCFVVHNPTVPEVAAQKGPDYDFLKKINDGESYSLLNCKHPWTLAIKVFHGYPVVHNTSVAEDLFKSLLGGAGRGVELDAGGQNAHNMAEAMRKMGFEAYVLHTKCNSVVCVGGYDRLDDPRMKSNKEALMKFVDLRAEASTAGAQLDPSRLQQQVQLLAEPLPMQVPQP